MPDREDADDDKSRMKTQRRRWQSAVTPRGGTEASAGNYRGNKSPWIAPLVRLETTLSSRVDRLSHGSLDHAVIAQPSTVGWQTADCVLTPNEPGRK